jgi:hypothetical protein
MSNDEPMGRLTEYFDLMNRDIFPRDFTEFKYIYPPDYREAWKERRDPKRDDVTGDG